MKIYLSILSIFIAGAVALYAADGSHMGDLKGGRQAVPEEPLPKFNSRDYLFGDWFGVRQTLYN